jgi:hypothetical protein
MTLPTRMKTMPSTLRALLCCTCFILTAGSCQDPVSNTPTSDDLTAQWQADSAFFSGVSVDRNESKMFLIRGNDTTIVEREPGVHPSVAYIMDSLPGESHIRIRSWSRTGHHTSVLRNVLMSGLYPLSSDTSGHFISFWYDARAWTSISGYFNLIYFSPETFELSGVYAATFASTKGDTIKVMTKLDRVELISHAKLTYPTVIYAGKTYIPQYITRSPRKHFVNIQASRFDVSDTSCGGERGALKEYFYLDLPISPGSFSNGDPDVKWHQGTITSFANCEPLYTTTSPSEDDRLIIHSFDTVRRTASASFTINGIPGSIDLKGWRVY